MRGPYGSGMKQDLFINCNAPFLFFHLYYSWVLSGGWFKASREDGDTFVPFQCIFFICKFLLLSDSFDETSGFPSSYMYSYGVNGIIAFMNSRFASKSQ